MRSLFLHLLLCYANAELPVSKKKNLTSKVIRDTAVLTDKLTTAQKRLAPTPPADARRTDPPKYKPDQPLPGPLVNPDYLPNVWEDGAGTPDELTLSPSGEEGSGYFLEPMPGSMDTEGFWDDFAPPAESTQVREGSGFGGGTNGGLNGNGAITNWEAVVERSRVSNEISDDYGEGVGQDFETQENEDRSYITENNPSTPIRPQSPPDSGASFGLSRHSILLTLTITSCLQFLLS